MAELLTRDGRPWVPSYLESIDAEKCLGCGRCYKVCGRGVMAPIDKPVDDDDDDDEACAATVMSVADGGACIGCEACSKVCSRGAQTYSC